jgi:hypothetical protein
MKKSQAAYESNLKYYNSMVLFYQIKMKHFQTLANNELIEKNRGHKIEESK